MSDVRNVLALWGMANAAVEFVAGRENRVYRVTAAQGDFALRIKRPGYRDSQELLSELDWLAAMDRAGLHVPRPLPSLSGQMLEPCGWGFADMVGWLPGRPLGQSRSLLQVQDRAGTFHAIGAEMARLHIACDGWQRPKGFRRCHWDIDGLLGEAPVWGRFWDNPTLDVGTRALFARMRNVARGALAGAALDHGLIHADLVRENLLLDGPLVRMIDFDDGGFGYRLFDLATLLLKTLDEPDYPALRAALITGYHSLRVLDLALLDLFIALRAVTYVGWIVPRMTEDGGPARNTRFVVQAVGLCAAYLETANAT